MSIWTQCNIQFIVRQKLSVSDIEDKFGYMECWNHYRIFDRRDEDDIHYYGETEPLLLPRGSEGTLNIIVKKTKKHKTVFNVVGGLRDCYSTEEISKWFDKVIENNKNIIVKAKGWAGTELSPKDITRFNYSETFKHFIEDMEWYAVSTIDNIIWNIIYKTRRIIRKIKRLIRKDRSE